VKFYMICNKATGLWWRVDGEHVCWITRETASAWTTFRDAEKAANAIACDETCRLVISVIDLEASKPSSVLQPWVETLGLRHQGCLLSSVRGCDSVLKEDPSKLLVRMLRGLMLRSFDPKPSSFIEPAHSYEHRRLRERMQAVLSNHDHYPVHYLMHLMHAAEITGYKYPRDGIDNSDLADSWKWFYEKLANCFHLQPETEEQMDRRLGACEAEFAKGQKCAST